MIQYRKKPVIIEAMGPLREESLQATADWCGGRPEVEVNPSDHTDIYIALHIPTLEGVMRADRGDYVIRGVQGEFYPCKPDIFAATYDLVGSK